MVATPVATCFKVALPSEVVTTRPRDVYSLTNRVYALFWYMLSRLILREFFFVVRSVLCSRMR